MENSTAASTVNSLSRLNSASMIDAALTYAALGLHIFPLHYIRKDGTCSRRNQHCASPGKHPITWHGQEDATTDARKIRDWWTMWPNADIGMHCKRSKLAVIDIDPRNDGNTTFAALEIAHGDITSPLASYTGGGGRHLFFNAANAARDPSNLPGKLGTGVDLKFNGYVLLPPSNHKSGKLYQWTDEATFNPPPLPHWIIPVSYERNDDDDVSDIEFLEFSEAVFALPQYVCDDYLEWIATGAAIYHQTDGDEDGYDLFDWWSQQSQKYKSAVETRRKWRSFRNGHNNPRTALSILKLARENGWKPWAETREPYGVYRNISGNTVLCVAAMAIENAAYEDRNTVRSHLLPVAMQIAKGNLDEQTAYETIAQAANAIGIYADEFQLMFEGALRWQQQQFKLEQFLAAERARTLDYFDDNE